MQFLEKETMEKTNNGCIMEKNIQNEQYLDDIKIKEYMNKYIQELKRHFDVSDKRMRSLVYEIYSELAPFSFFKNS